MKIKRLLVEFTGDWSSFVVWNELNETYIITKRSVAYPATRQTMCKILEDAGYSYEELCKLEQAKLTEEFVLNLPERTQLLQELAMSPVIEYIDLAHQDTDETSAIKVSEVVVSLKPITKFIPKVWSLTDLIFQEKEQYINLNRKIVKDLVLESIGTYGYVSLNNDSYRVIVSVTHIRPEEVPQELELRAQGVLNKVPPLNLLIDYLRRSDWHIINFSAKAFFRWAVKHDLSIFAKYADRIFLITRDDKAVSLAEILRAPVLAGRLEVASEIDEEDRELLISNLAEVIT